MQSFLIRLRSRLLNLHRSSQGRKPEWEQLCEQIRSLQEGEAGKDGGSGGSGPPSSSEEHQWRSRAKDAEYRLVQICSLLIGAPDPLPFFGSVAGLSARIVGEWCR